MSGAIMPEPLANPLRRTATPSISAAAVEPLGKVSVVMIARAACSQPSAESRAAASGSAPRIFSVGRVSPMTPVEAMKTCFGSHPSSCAAAAAVVATASLPARPVNTLALPELTTIARACPPERHSRHHSTGAPAVNERVKTPATAVPGASSASIRSSRPA